MNDKIIATRELSDELGVVVVRICEPELSPTSPHGDYECLLSIKVDDVAQAHRIPGVDAIQALLNALEGARLLLSRMRRPNLKWKGSAFPGSTGFSRILRDDVDSEEVRDRLYAAVDREFDAIEAERAAARGET